MGAGGPWAGGLADTVVRIRYDSEYAANTARGLWKAKKNRRLVNALREEVKRLENWRTGEEEEACCGST